MQKTVIFSKTDKAGVNIASLLEKEYGIAAFECGEEILYLNNGHALPETCLCIVASRHKSVSGTPSLTAHSPGNYGTAEAGGSGRELGYAPAHYLHRAVALLRENPVTGYESCLEATHHGPTGLPFPVIFVEVGSTAKEWDDLSACAAAARTIAGLVYSDPDPGGVPAAIGFGGGHYCRKFSSVSDYALGHICPKYNLGNLDSSLVEQMILKTVPQPEYAIIEKKGLGGEKKRVRSILSETGLQLIEI